MDNRLRDQGSYLRVKANLDEIAEKIRDKDLPLEQALDLYEEAIRLGNSCADLIDTTDFSAEELEVYNGMDPNAAEASEDAAASVEEGTVPDAPEAAAGDSDGESDVQR